MIYYLYICTCIHCYQFIGITNYTYFVSVTNEFFHILSWYSLPGQPWEALRCGLHSATLGGRRPVPPRSRESYAKRWMMSWRRVKIVRIVVNIMVQNGECCLIPAKNPSYQLRPTNKFGIILSLHGLQSHACDVIDGEFWSYNCEYHGFIRMDQVDDN